MHIRELTCDDADTKAMRPSSLYNITHRIRMTYITSQVAIQAVILQCYISYVQGDIKLGFVICKF